MRLANKHKFSDVVSEDFASIERDYANKKYHDLAANCKKLRDYIEQYIPNVYLEHFNVSERLKKVQILEHYYAHFNFLNENSEMAQVFAAAKLIEGRIELYQQGNSVCPEFSKIDEELKKIEAKFPQDLIQENSVSLAKRLGQAIEKQVSADANNYEKALSSFELIEAANKKELAISSSEQKNNNITEYFAIRLKKLKEFLDKKIKNLQQSSETKFNEFSKIKKFNELTQQFEQLESQQQDFFRLEYIIEQEDIVRNLGKTEAAASDNLSFEKEFSIVFLGFKKQLNVFNAELKSLNLARDLINNRHPKMPSKEELIENLKKVNGCLAEVKISEKAILINLRKYYVAKVKDFVEIHQQLLKTAKNSSIRVPAEYEANLANLNQIKHNLDEKPDDVLKFSDFEPCIAALEKLQKSQVHQTLQLANNYYLHVHKMIIKLTDKQANYIEIINEVISTSENANEAQFKNDFIKDFSEKKNKLEEFIIWYDAQCQLPADTGERNIFNYFLNVKNLTALASNIDALGFCLKDIKPKISELKRNLLVKKENTEIAEEISRLIAKENAKRTFFFEAKDKKQAALTDLARLISDKACGSQEKINIPTLVKEWETEEIKTILQTERHTTIELTVANCFSHFFHLKKPIDIIAPKFASEPRQTRTVEFIENLKQRYENV